MIHRPPQHAPRPPRHPRLARVGAGAWRCALVLVAVGACRIEPVDAPPSLWPPATDAVPAPAAGAAVVGLMPNAELLRRITAMLCEAAGSDRDPREATYVALRALECERRGQGVAFSQALIMDTDSWGAVSALPDLYLASDAAFAALSEGHGLSVGVSGPLPQADCDPAALGDMGDALADLMVMPGHPLPPRALDPLDAQPTQGVEGSDETPDDGELPEGDDADAGAPDQPALIAGASPAEGSEYDEGLVADAGIAAELAVPRPGAQAAEPSAPAAAPTQSVYGVLWRDGSGRLHGGLLAAGRSAQAPGIAAGLDVMPGQLLYIGPDGGALVHGQRPRDPSQAAAPAASALMEADNADFADTATPDRQDAAWVLPAAGPAAQRGSPQRTTFLAQQCATITRPVTDAAFARDPARQAPADRGPAP